MKKLIASLAAAVALVFVAANVPAVSAEPAKTEDAAKAKADRDAKIEAMKVTAKEKLAKAKAVIAEKAKQASDAAKAAYDKAKAEYDAAQTPDAKAKRSAKISAMKLAAKEKYAKAKAVIAEKAQKLAEATKAEYEKLKAATAAKTAPAAPDKK